MEQKDTEQKYSGGDLFTKTDVQFIIDTVMDLERDRQKYMSLMKEQLTPQQAAKLAREIEIIKVGASNALENFDRRKKAGELTSPLSRPINRLAYQLQRDIYEQLLREIIERHHLILGGEDGKSKPGNFTNFDPQKHQTYYEKLPSGTRVIIHASEIGIRGENETYTTLIPPLVYPTAPGY